MDSALLTTRYNFAAARQVLERAIAQCAFPGASVAVTCGDEPVWIEGFGRFTYAPDSPVVTKETIFDLASLSKVIVTTTAAMLLYERGVLTLESAVPELLPGFLPRPSDPRWDLVTLEMLLCHSSGLPGYSPLYNVVTSAQEFVHGIFDIGLQAAPGTRMEYSDLGFILLGFILEHAAGEPLNAFIQREIFQPLGMTRTAFNPPEDSRTNIPPTEEDQDYRHRVIQGEVHDENASFLGGVAGHAGIFSTGEDLGRFALWLLGGGVPILKSDTVDLFTRRAALPPGTSRALGWDTPSPPSQSGVYFGPRSYGHLGFTGTSLWIDPDRELSVTLLTNRTWPNRKSQEIRRVRPEFHDRVVEALSRLETFSLKEE